VKAFVLAVIKGYKICISPFLPQTCRFQPTCSSYCAEAVEKYGTAKGLWLFAKRIIKCHPFHPGGYDPVDPVRKDHSEKTGSHDLRLQSMVFSDRARHLNNTCIK
jgi:putative membrane protein insertion efficiency factor